MKNIQKLKNYGTEKNIGDTEKILNELLPYLPKRISESLYLHLPELIGICEIRFTVSKPVIAQIEKDIFILDDAFENQIIADRSCVDFIINAVSNGSIYSVNESIKEGFVTIPGGHRIGFCGTAVTEDGEVKHIKNVSAVCVRISREAIGCADSLIDEIYENGEILNVLIASPPGCGKTTVLRDICRILSNRMMKVGIADERGEIAAVYNGISHKDTGKASFVCDGYIKSKAIKMMLRSMSPDIIATDEIGDAEDFKAVLSAQHSGVKVIATAHAGSFDDLKFRFGEKILESCFDRIIFLKNRGNTDKIYRRSEYGN